MIKFKQKKKAILEISSGGVKLLMGPLRRPQKFKIQDFKYYKTITKTKSGLQSGIMNVGWFKENVLPVIRYYLKAASGCDITAVATAWARDCKNIKEVLRLIPIPVKILSGKEEAGMSLIGYMNSTTRNLNEWDNVISLDLGNLSTELAILGGIRLSVSKTDTGKLDSIFSSLKGKTLVAISKSLWDMKTGNPTKMYLHDQEFPDNDGIIGKIKNLLSPESLVVYNGTNLSFGVYYDKV